MLHKFFKKSSVLALFSLSFCFQSWAQTTQVNQASISEQTDISSKLISNNQDTLDINQEVAISDIPQEMQILEADSETKKPSENKTGEDLQSPAVEEALDKPIVTDFQKVKPTKRSLRSNNIVHPNSIEASF